MLYFSELQQSRPYSCYRKAKLETLGISMSLAGPTAVKAPFSVRLRRPSQIPQKSG